MPTRGGHEVLSAESKASPSPTNLRPTHHHQCRSGALLQQQHSSQRRSWGCPSLPLPASSQSEKEVGWEEPSHRLMAYRGGKGSSGSFSDWSTTSISGPCHGADNCMWASLVSEGKGEVKCTICGATLLIWQKALSFVPIFNPYLPSFLPNAFQAANPGG